MKPECYLNFLSPRKNGTVKKLASEAVRFGLVGIIGLAVDITVLHLTMRWFAFGPLVGRLWSYLAGATTTWALNRTFTFSNAASSSIPVQWVRFLAVNAIGGMINYATYAGLVATYDLFAQMPAFAVPFGSLAGMSFNFTFSKLLVFRSGFRLLGPAKSGLTDCGSNSLCQIEEPEASATSGWRPRGWKPDRRERVSN